MIIIDAKKWFDKVNGNTYHSVRVYQDGKEIGYSGMTYGYGEQYLQTAFEILSKNGIFSYETDKTLVPNLTVFGKPTDSYHEKTYDNCQTAWANFRKDMRENPENYHVTVNQTTRKRDL